VRVPALASFGIAILSIAYAVVFLGFVRGHPDAHGASAIANGSIAASGILVTAVAAALGSRFESLAGAGRWISTFGAGYGLLSAAHGAFAAISELGGTTPPGISPTDPRGFATFGLAGLWVLVVGLAAPADAPGWPGWLTPVAIVGGIDLLALFVATVAGAENPILITGGLASVVLGPAFWIGVGRFLSITSNRA
jgi:hypothetical protein